MNSSRRRLMPGVAASAALLLISVRFAAAELIATENFAYSPGETLSGQAGGAGFQGTWFEGGADRDGVVAPSLAFPSLGSAGNALESRAPVEFGSNLSRNLSAPISGTAGTVLWVSYVLRKDGNGSLEWSDYFGLVLYPSAEASDALFIGDTGETDFYSLGIAGSENGQVVSTHPSAVSDSSTLLVVKITFSDGPDVIDLFINPDPLAGEPTMPTITKNDLDLVDIKAIGLLGGYDARWMVDEIRIATRFVEAVPREVRITSFAIAPAVALQATGNPSELHHLESTGDLSQPFTRVDSVMADANGNLTFNDATSPRPPQRFYRVVFP